MLNQFSHLSVKLLLAEVFVPLYVRKEPFKKKKLLV